jgi:hypothetical protein
MAVSQVGRRVLSAGDQPFRRGILLLFSWHHQRIVLSICFSKLQASVASTVRAKRICRTSRIVLGMLSERARFAAATSRFWNCSREPVSMSLGKPPLASLNSTKSSEEAMPASCSETNLGIHQ